jgi:hypothetical protein
MIAAEAYGSEDARQASPRPNSREGQGETTHQGPLAHALPTSHVEDPDLALIVGEWGRLPDGCKRQLIEIVQESLG